MEEGEEKIPDINEFKMMIFEAENPKGAMKLKKRVERKMQKTQTDIVKMMESEVNKFIEEKAKNMPRCSYIG